MVKMTLGTAGRPSVPRARQQSSSSSDSSADSDALSGKSSPICWNLPDCASHMYLMVTLNSAISYPKSFCRRQRNRVRRSGCDQESLVPPSSLQTAGRAKLGSPGRGPALGSARRPPCTPHSRTAGSPHLQRGASSYFWQRFLSAAQSWEESAWPPVPPPMQHTQGHGLLGVQQPLGRSDCLPRCLLSAVYWP